MVRSAAAACIVIAILAPSPKADELCIKCDKPAATYRCTFEQPTHNEKLQLGPTAQGHICEQVLASTGPHETCRLIPDATTCDGRPQTVTLHQYQQVVAPPEGQSTYEPGALERARRSATATWNCVASLFNDC
jgi:hypothetical protein